MSNGDVRLEWHGDAFARKLERDLNSRLEKVGQELDARTKSNVSIPTASAGPSAPGDFPHMDTGDVRSKVGHIVSGNTLTHYCASQHAMPLEVGTRFMEPRPFITKTVNQMAGRIFKIIVSGG